MPEWWLRTNRRALLLGLIFPSITLVFGITLATFPHAMLPWPPLRWMGWLFAAAAVWLFAAIAYHCALPRLAREGDELLVYLRSGAPLRAPLGIVECFFLGQGSAAMRDLKGVEPEVATIVVRLAESAKEYHDRSVKPQLGNWCDGYIIIRGTWCEPITPALMKRLNARLVEAHRAMKNGTSTPA